MPEHGSYEFDSILQRMMDRVPETLDKREGSILWNALAPAAAELVNLYLELEVILHETFADTASREYLVRRCAERGISPEPATRAVFKGVFSRDVPIGSRFSLEEFNYLVTQRLSPGVFQLECETPGSAPNSFLGRLVPIEYLYGLERGELTELLIPGEDAEETEHLRKRYFDSLNAQAFGGNIQDYKDKVNALPGVGGVRVYPVWNGGGTVKLVILDSQFQKPSPELVNRVQTAVDPVQNQGKGAGLAPIGHVVTAEAAAETAVNAALQVTYAPGWDWPALRPYAEQVLDGYLAELNRSWEDSSFLTVRVAQLESRLLDLEGVADVGNTLLNGKGQNLVLDPASIAVRGELFEQNR